MKTYSIYNNQNLQRVAVGIILAIILFFAAWVRFDGITEQGISYGDAFRYMREAKLWAEGQPPKFALYFYRPVSYFLHGTALRVFGYNDYSIKMLHGLIDLLNILLIFFFASKFSKNLWSGVFSSLLYAFLPRVVSSARSEFLQVQSTLFVLLALFFFVLFEDRKKDGLKEYFLLFLSGACSGLAANTHGTLAFLAPGYVLYFLITTYNSQDKKKFIKEFFILASIYSFSFFTPYFIGFLIFGPNRVIELILGEMKFATWYHHNITHPIPTLKLFGKVLYQSTSHHFAGAQSVILVSVLISGSILIMISRIIKKKAEPFLAYFPFLLIFLFVTFYSVLFSSTESCSRYTFPLIPLVIITVIYWYYKVFLQCFGKYYLTVFFCLFLAVFLVMPKKMPGGKFRKSEYRFIYDVLKNDVNPDNKLLLAPVTRYSFDRGFQLDLYFGQNAIYLGSLPLNQAYNLESLKSLLKNKKIRFIFIAHRVDRRLLNPDFPFKGNIKCWLGNKKRPYSLEKDLEIIRDYIQSRGGMCINTNRFGEIYYLIDDYPANENEDTRLFSNGSFEHWRKGFPVGTWELQSGRISEGKETTDGLKSICFEPNLNKNSKGTWITHRIYKLLSYKKALNLKVSMDVKAGKPNNFIVSFTGNINGKRAAIKTSMLKYEGKGDWETLSKVFRVTPEMNPIIMHLLLRTGASKPAFVDNLSITIKRNSHMVGKSTNKTPGEK